jgi:diguanylate cyclase (GGDEF)-like protein
MRAMVSQIIEILRLSEKKNQDRANLRTIRIVILILFFGMIPLFVVNHFWTMSGLVESISAAMVIISLAFWLATRGYTKQSILLVGITMTAVVTYNATMGQGIHDIVVVAFPGILIATALVLNFREILILSILHVAAVGWLVYSEMLAWFPHPPIMPADTGDFFVVTTVIVISAAWVALISRQSRHNLLNAQVELRERKRFEEQLHFNAFHDHLTGLPNRALLLDRLDQLIRRRRRSPDFLFAILFMDLDGFKDVNDSLGHKVGDELLIDVAQRVHDILREVDTVARLGGDEFVILLDNLRDTNEAIEVAKRVQEQLKLPFKLAEGNLSISASIGIVYAGDQYEVADDMLKDADIAMYRSKALGKAQQQVFDPSMREKILARLKLQNDLSGALERGEFELFYQPVVRIATGQVIGAEALLRWRHPQAGLTLPGQFIPVAEENGLMLPIGNWVLQQACQQAQAWNTTRPDGQKLTISVNLTLRQFTHPDFARLVCQALAKTGLPAAQLEFEITENVVMENVDMAIIRLHELQSQGVAAAMDDFGAGLSSLSYLVTLPIQAVKLDFAFITQLDTVENKIEIIRTVIGLAHSIGLQVIVVGVETAEQLTWLKETGCDAAQGYLFAPPLAADEVVKYL